MTIPSDPPSNVKHQKLVWVRDEKRFYKYTATLHEEFEFGSPAFREYCKAIAVSDNIPTNNKFIGDFLS